MAQEGKGMIDPQQKEIYTFKAPWTIYSLAWSNWNDPSSQFRLAIGSYIDRYCNVIRIVKKRSLVSEIPTKSNIGDIFTVCEFSHPYPATKIQWSPDTRNGTNPQELLATSGDYLRLWDVRDDGTGRGTSLAKKISLFNNNKTSELCAPITSFEWNEIDPNIIGTCSIDTTCTIWDVQSETARTQLIAHESEVLDIAFADQNVFATVGADGSIRMFDLRNLDHSTIIYESVNLAPLLRLEWNKLNPNFIATFAADSSSVNIVDIRRLPSQSMIELKGHNGYVNALAWAPHSPNHICTSADDCQAYIWDISRHVVEGNDPILAYTAAGEVNNMKWCSIQPDWVSIVFREFLQILRV